MYKSLLNLKFLAIHRCTNDDDIEMIAFHGPLNNYTSLKDLMPESPPSPASPAFCRGDSWREIPIRDPLLQHAAWAYLQPMMGVDRRGEGEGRRWWRRFHDKLCWLLSCFDGVVFVVFEGWFPVRLRERFMIKI